MCLLDPGLSGEDQGLGLGQECSSHQRFLRGLSLRSWEGSNSVGGPHRRNQGMWGPRWGKLRSDWP